MRFHDPISIEGLYQHDVLVELNQNPGSGGGIVFDASHYSAPADVTSTINGAMRLYGGYRLPYALELDAHAGFGFTPYAQERQVHNQRYSNKYNGQNSFVGLGIGRPFALGSGFSLRPAWLMTSST